MTQTPVSRAALITGASTGIGRAIALSLDQAGWTVYAGVRDETAAGDLRKSGSSRLIPVRLDVTETASIADVARQIEAECNDGLSGLVNNAGVPGFGPVEYLDLEALRNVFEVNVIGPVAVTQALLPAVRRGHGRVVFISSISGRVAVPFLSPYAASKYALEAVGDSLRREVAPNIRVSLIEPGNIATPIWAKALNPAIRAALPPAAELTYGPGLDFAQQQGERAARTAIDADRVAQAVRHALHARRPRRRYVVGRDAHIGIALGLLTPGLLDRAIRSGVNHTRRSNARN